MAGGVIIAVCGDSGAGKSTTTEILRDLGFRSYSLSGILRQEAELVFGTPTRPQVQGHGRDMQLRHGNDYYAARLIDGTDLMSQDRAVIDGLRNPDELGLLRERAEAMGNRLVLLALVLDPDARFERVRSRARVGDSPDIDQFRNDDARANGAEGAFQNNQLLMEQADIRIENSGDLTTLRTRVAAIVATLLAEPNKDSGT